MYLKVILLVVAVAQILFSIYVKNNVNIAINANNNVARNKKMILEFEFLLRLNIIFFIFADWSMKERLGCIYLSYLSNQEYCGANLCLNLYVTTGNLPLKNLTAFRPSIKDIVKNMTLSK